MRYLHTMLRVHDLDESLKFWVDIMGMKEVTRKENEGGRFTLVFLAADEDTDSAQSENAPNQRMPPWLSLLIIGQKGKVRKAKPTKAAATSDILLT